MTAVDTARQLERLMHAASFGTDFVPSVEDCEARANAAMKVRCYLTGAGYWGGPPPTRDEAIRHANRAWPTGLPDDVAEALAAPDT